MCEEEILPVPGNRYLCTIQHFNISAFLPDIFFNILQVYKERIMGAEEISLVKNILEFLQMFRDKYLPVPCKIEPGITPVRLNSEDLFRIQVFHPVSCRYCQS